MPKRNAWLYFMLYGLFGPVAGLSVMFLTRPLFQEQLWAVVLGGVTAISSSAVLVLMTWNKLRPRLDNDDKDGDDS